MRIVIQRVTQASVSVDDNVVAAIGVGLMILVGVERGDSADDADWLAEKTVGLRIFNDDLGIMNRSLTDIDGNILAVSQFTLTASTRKGKRPSYYRAAPGEESQPVYDHFCRRLESLTGRSVGQGIFGADMKVALVNDGPVTIIIDSHLRE